MDPTFGMRAENVQGYGTGPGGVSRADVYVNPLADLVPPSFYATTTNETMSNYTASSNCMRTVDMSPSNFNKVTNFDALSAAQNGLKLPAAAANGKDILCYQQWIQF